MLGGGVNGHCTLFKMFIVIAFSYGVGKIYIFKVLFCEGRRGDKKEHSVYAFDNVDTFYGWPPYIANIFEAITIMNTIYTSSFHTALDVV